MVTIEYDNFEIRIPTSWNDITLGEYEGFYTDKPDTPRERVAWIAKVCHVEIETLLGWPVDIFNLIVDKCDFLFKPNLAEPTPSVEIKGITYVVPVEDKLSIGAYIDADEVQREEKKVLSNILAIVCRPAGEEYNYENNEARAALFASLPFSKIQGILAFFLHCKNGLDKRTTACTNLAQAVGSLPLNINVLQRPGGGIRLYRIWQAMKYYALMLLLNWRLRKLLHSFNTKGIKIMPKTHKEN